MMRLDLCLPARNEAAHIQDALRRLVRSLQELDSSVYPASPDTGLRHEIEWQILVAVNGTTDNTLQQVESFKNQNPKFNIQALSCSLVGKGAAIKYAAQQSSATPSSSTAYSAMNTERSSLDTKNNSNLFGFIDADLSSDPEAIPGLVELVVRDQADIVIASRLVQTRTTNRGLARTLSSRLFNLMSRLILGLAVKDAQCGLKIMNAKAREVLMKCEEAGWFLDIEFLAKARQYGLRVLEVPVPWIEFRYPDRRSQISHLRDGVGALRAMLRIRRRGKG